MNLIKIIQILILAIFVIPLNSQAENNGPPYYGKPAGDPVRGATEWANNCARCHNMRNPSEHSDDVWRVIISHMRSRAGLTGQQSRDILAYLINANYLSVTYEMEEAAEVEEEKFSGVSGQQIFSKTCIACHGADGKGAISGVPDLADRLSKPRTTLVKNVTEGFQSPGSQMMMPPRGGNPDLTHEEIEAVVDYLMKEFGK